MKTKLLLIITAVLSIAACTKENLIVNTTEETTNVIITGNSMSGFNNNKSKASTIEYIPKDESILFFSTGGIKANGDTLSYNNGVWTGLKDNNWYTDEGEAHVIAYYPIINNYNLYDNNGELKDLVYCKTTAQPGESINLSFNHIFSKIVFNIEKGLNDTINQINVNIPLKIDNFNLNTCEYSFYDNQNGNISFERNETGVYEFFVPASENMPVSFEIVCPNIRQTSNIGNNNFNAGYEYVCNISKRKNKGIYTKEDFIAFTHLINGEAEYNGKTIEDLYYMENGKRVFSLHNDLYFTEEESALMRRIADNKKVFDDVFDGNNHSLNDITLPTNNISTYTGLFDNISKNAHVKNLTIVNCSTSYNDYTSLMVGSNNGLIENCHVIGGSIKSEMTIQRVSGFTIRNAGYIINSSISGFKSEYIIAALGVMTFQNNGSIINCRIKNDEKIDVNSQKSSVITTTNNGKLINIFVERYNKDYYGVCHQNEKITEMINCVIPSQYSNKYINNNLNPSPVNGIIFYNDTNEEYQNIVDKLNNWIDNEGKNSYPQFTFRRWKTDDTQKVVFE